MLDIVIGPKGVVVDHNGHIIHGSGEATHNQRVTVQRKALTLSWAVIRLNTYLFKKKFTIFTDLEA